MFFWSFFRGYYGQKIGSQCTGFSCHSDVGQTATRTVSLELPGILKIFCGHPIAGFLRLDGRLLQSAEQQHSENKTYKTKMYDSWFMVKLQTNCLCLIFSSEFLSGMVGAPEASELKLHINGLSAVQTGTQGMGLLGLPWDYHGLHQGLSANINCTKM